jgi:hypothetical protein
MKQAMLDPESVFECPEDILEEQSLSKPQKIELLKRWKYEAWEVCDASTEGMLDTNESDLLRRITLALESLEENA